MVLMQTVTLSIRISKAEKLALRRRARQEHISQSTLIRRALRAYGAIPEPDNAKTGYDVIKHLIGRSRGHTPDLSSNPKHMERFGE